MVVGLLLLVLVVVLVVLAVRRTHGRGAVASPDGHTVRRFFQYLVLYGLLVVAGIGLSGLLGRLLQRHVLVTGDEAALARDLAFTVVGVPLLVAVALWSRRRFAQVPDEGHSLAWAFYITAAALTSLVTAMTALSTVLRWAVGLQEYDGQALAVFLVWGGIWGAHLWLDGRVTPREHARIHLLAGSLVGLATAATGLAGILAGAIRSLLGLDVNDVLIGHANPVLPGLVTFVVGAPVWAVYWFRATARYRGEILWVGYVLLAGVAAGLVTAIAAASTLFYTVLVWLVGEPRTTDAVEHFRGAPSAAAAAVVGLLVWWYHQAALEAAGAKARTEVRRIYEYLMAGIGLLAAAGGLTTAFVALIEAATGTAQVLVGRSVVNTLLAALTLLAVGVPVWWLYWRRIQSAARASLEEITSPTRRVYLFILFGVGGVAAVVALIVGVYLFFEDAVNGTLGVETLRRTRFAIGVLLSTGAIAAYHWTVYRDDRRRVPSPVEARGPRFVLLVGPADTEIAHAVARRTHGRVQAWARTDDGAAPWSVDEVMAALEGVTADEVVVLRDAEGVRTIPVRRG